MKNLFSMLFALAWFSCQQPGKEQQATASFTENELREWIATYDQSWALRDTTKMKQIMDERYIYFTSTGRTIDRANIINWFTPADKYKVDIAARTEIQFFLQDDIAIVSSRWIGSGTFGDEKFNDDQRCSLVLQKKNGLVKIISEHCTQIVK